MDDFSFPIMATNTDQILPFPHFAASPLWFVDGQTLPSEDTVEKSLSDPGFASKPSVPEVGSKPSENSEVGLKPSENSDKEPAQLSKEERMDMLWEEFNQEICKREEVQESPESDDAAELCCIRALGVTSSSGLLHHGRPGLEMLLKVLKRLFSIQESGRRLRRPSIAHLGVSKALKNL